MTAVLRLLLTSLMILSLAACAELGMSPTSSKKENVDEAPSSYYYQFEDVQVPVEMKLKDSESYVIQTGNIKTGVQTFYGHVDLFSLVDFFKNTMPRDGWTTRSAVASKRSILVFEKGDKDCIIHISPDVYDTRLEVWQAPRSFGAAPARSAAPAPSYAPQGGGYGQPGGYQQPGYSQPGQPGGYGQPGYNQPGQSGGYRPSGNGGFSQERSLSQ